MGFLQKRAFSLLSISYASLHYCHQCCYCQLVGALSSALTVIFSSFLLSPALLLQPHSQSFQSGIMYSSDIYKPVQRFLPLTICMYFFSVMSSIFIVAGSLTLVIAGACWVR